MCEECLQYPCHPRCPNAVIPVACHCDVCDAEILDGEEMYDIDGMNVCENCIIRGRKTAVCED